MQSYNSSIKAAYIGVRIIYYVIYYILTVIIYITEKFEFFHRYSTMKTAFILAGLLKYIYSYYTYLNMYNYIYRRYRLGDAVIVIINGLFLVFQVVHIVMSLFTFYLDLLGGGEGEKSCRLESQ